MPPPRELSDTEKMVAAAEKLYGPYRWGRYDMLVLPPSFPYGGMENPTLTFLTPTFIAGDKSLVSLVAHELSHSWSGNLATNATWDDFWLNEGMTTYAEGGSSRSSTARRRGRGACALGIDAHEQGGRRERRAERRRTPGSTSTSTAASRRWRSSDIAYEKGAAFLRTIEAIVGRDRVRRLAQGLVRPPRLPAGHLGDVPRRPPRQPRSRATRRSKTG